MNTDPASPRTPAPKGSAPAPTRRQMLSLMASGTFLAAGGGLLSSCARRGASTDGHVVLKTSGGWPYGPMPTRKDQKANPGTKSYADVLSAWMDKNPGVTIQDVKLDVWNQQTLSTAITGGTAPSMFPGDVLGGWNRQAVRAAMAQGLSADVTEHLKAHDIAGKLETYVKPIWEKWQVDGKFYAAPWIYNVGTGLHYRVDLVRELGLKEPTPDWTWDDVRTLAKGLTKGKRKGIVLQGWGLNMRMSADGMDFHAKLPAPATNWNWRWDYMAGADSWVPLIQGMRDMVYKDKSVLADVSMGDGDTLAAFVRGDAAMHNNTVIFFANTPGSDTAPADLAARLKKPIEDVVGWMTQPIGLNGRTGTTQGQVDIVGFSPDMDDLALDKAISLHAWMKGPGWVEQKKATYAATKDPKRVFDSADFMPLFAGLLEQMPVSPDDAWGKPFMDQVRRASKIPLVPNEAFYFPAELSPGPTGTARDDMTSRWANERGTLDLRGDLEKMQATMNAQAGSFSSSTSDPDFTKAAREYFGAHDTYWRDNAPDYHRDVFSPWYQNSVLPALKG